MTVMGVVGVAVVGEVRLGDAADWLRWPGATTDASIYTAFGQLHHAITVDN